MKASQTSAPARSFVARSRAIAGAFAAVLLLSFVPAQAQDQSAAPPHENWATGCTAAGREAPLDCSVEQRTVDGRTGRMLAMVRVRVPSDTRKPVMLIQLPLGIYLPGKLSLDVDGKALEPVEFQNCDTGGCYSGFPVADGFLDMMLKGQTLSLKVKNQRREDTTLPITLSGFAKAFAQVK